MLSFSYPQILKELDREQADTHLLIVKASEDCITSPKIDQPVIFDPHDDTMLRVVIKVNDINDNSPKFVKKVFTGGVTTESDFGTEFMQIKVIIMQFSIYISPEGGGDWVPVSKKMVPSCVNSSDSLFKFFNNF